MKKSLYSLCCILITLYIYLLLAANVLLPRIIDNIQVHNLLVQQIHKAQPSLTVTFERLQFSWLLLPEVKIKNLYLHFEKITAACPQIRIYINPVDILQGKYVPCKIVINRPKISALFSNHSKQELRLGGLRKYSSLIDIRQGQIALQKDRDKLLLNNLNVTTRIDKDGLSLQGDSQIEKSGKISINIFSRWPLQSVQGQCLISRLDIQPILKFIPLPESKVTLQDGYLKSLSCNFTIAPNTKSIIKLRGSIPHLQLKGREIAELEIHQLRLSFLSERNRYRLKIAQLDLGSPRAQLNGEIRWQHPKPDLFMDLHGKDIDLLDLRQETEMLADNSLTKEIFTIIRGGHLAQLHIKLQGNTPQQLANSLFLNATLRQGNIWVPHLASHLKAVNGQVNVRGDVLTGKDLSAQMGSSTAQKGTFILGLNKSARPFLLDLDLDADLSDLPDILQRTTSEPLLLDELKLISQLQGKARGRLFIKGQDKKYIIQVLAKAFELQGKYQRIAYPIAVKGKQFSYENKEIAGTDWMIRIGHSNFLINRVKFSWDNSLNLQLDGKNARLRLSELINWLKNYPGLQDKSALIVPPYGDILLHTFALDLPLSAPSKAIYHIQGKVNNLQLSLPAAPWPIRIKQSAFAIDNTATELTDCQLALSNQILQLNATLPSPTSLTGQRGPFDFLLHIQGACPADKFNQLIIKAGCPGSLQTQNDLIFPELFIKKQGDKTQIRSTVQNKQGQTIKADLIFSPGLLKVEQLSVRDKFSDCTFKLQTNYKSLFLLFSGYLDHISLNHLLKENHILTGKLAGDFNFNCTLMPLDIKQAWGKLSLTGFTPRFLPENMLTIHRLKLAGTGQQLTIQKTRLGLFGQAIDLSGAVTLDPKLDKYELSASMDRMDGDKLWSRFAPLLNNTGNKDLLKKLKGKLSLKIGTLLLHGFPLNNLQSRTFFSAQNIQSALNATCCTLSLQATLDARQPIKMSVSTRAENASLEQTLTCLNNKKRFISGRFAMKSTIQTTGQNSTELARNMRGKGYFKAQRGRIYKFNLLAKILAILNSTEALFGNMPDLDKKGFAYKKITIHPELAGSTLKIKQGIIDGESMEIAFQGRINLSSEKLNLTVLVSPLKTIDRVVKNIPLANQVLGGNLISIPLQVRGTMAHPIIIPLSPKAVSRELMGILRRTIKLPITILQPYLPDKSPDK